MRSVKRKTYRLLKNGGKSEDTTRKVMDRYLDKGSMDELLYDLEFFDSEGGIKDSTNYRKYLMDLIEFSSRKTGTPKLDIIQRFNNYIKSGNTSTQDPYKALGLSASELHYFPPHIYHESSQQFNTVGGDHIDNRLIERGVMERPNYPLIPEEQYMPSIVQTQPTKELQKQGASIADTSKGRREPVLIYKSSNKTRTGQVPDYYRYFDSNGRPKKRPVEPEEYDRYMRENRIRNPQVVKASF